MSAMEDFIATHWTHTHWTHFPVVVVGEKENIKDAIKAELINNALIPLAKLDFPSCFPFSSFIQAHGLTFELQKEMLVLQLEHDKIKHKQIEVERMHQELDRANMDLERSRSAMRKEGTLTGEARRGLTPGSFVPRFDVNNVRLLPQLNERDTFFLLFERVVKARGWPEADCSYVPVYSHREGARSVFNP